MTGNVLHSDELDQKLMTSLPMAYLHQLMKKYLSRATCRCLHCLSQTKWDVAVRPWPKFETAQTLPVQNTSLSAKKITGLTSIYGALGPLITNLQTSNHIFRLNSYLDLRNTHYLAWIWHRFLPPKWPSDLLRIRFSSCMWASCDRRKSNWRFRSCYIVVKIIMAPCG